MEHMQFIKGRTYRNRRMREVDMHILSLDLGPYGSVNVHCCWISRVSNQIWANDKVVIKRENFADWELLSSSSS